MMNSFDPKWSRQEKVAYIVGYASLWGIFGLLLLNYQVVVPVMKPFVQFMAFGYTINFAVQALLSATYLMLILVAAMLAILTLIRRIKA